MRTSHSIMLVAFFLLACASTSARAQNIAAVSGTFPGPDSDNLATFNYTAGASADEFTFDPSIGCDSPTPAPGCDPTLLQPGRYQIFGTNIFGDFWTDCPGVFGAPVVVLSGVREITCSDVPTGIASRGKRIRVRNTNSVALPSLTGTFARYNFTIPARASGGNARSFVNNTQYFNDGNNTGGGTGTSGTLTITMNPNPPTLAYSPNPGNTLTFPAGPTGSNQVLNLGVSASGGSGSGTVSLSCSAPGFSVQPPQQNGIGFGGSATAVQLGCAVTALQQSGTLSCTENYSTGGSQLRQWPVTCPAALQPIYASSPRPTAVVAAYGTLNVPTAQAVVAVSNPGLATLTIGNCALTPSAPFGISLTPSVDAGAGGNITIDCTAPPPGTRIERDLTCDTNDPARPVVLYPFECVAPPLAAMGTSSSPLPRLSSPVADADAMLGASAAAAEGPGGEEVIVVGAPEGGSDGRAYVNVRTPSQMTKAAGDGYSIAEDEALGPPVAVLEPPPSGARAKGFGDKFGSAVAVSDDGDTIAVGAPGATALDAGTVFVYERPPGGWGDLGVLDPVEIAAPAPAGGVTASGFGSTLQFDADGALLVGAPLSTVNGNTSAGAAWMLEDTGATWTQSGATLTATTPQASAAFGSALADQGDLVAVGAPGEQSSTGALYVYAESGGTLGGVTRMVAPAGAFGDKWGTSVAIGAGVLAVGASGDDTAAGVDSGSVSILLLGTGTSATAAGTLLPDAGAGQQAGTALATNGSLILVGAPLADSFQPDSGRAYAYVLDNTIAATELPDGFYENAIGESGDRYGSAIAIGPRRAVIGAPFSDETDGDQEGRADPFLLDGIFRDNLER